MIPPLSTERNRRRGAMLLPGAGGGLHEPARVLLGAFGEERVAGVLAETGRPPQGRTLDQSWEGEDADRFERCTFAVPNVLQSAQLQRRLVQPDQQDDLV